MFFSDKIDRCLTGININYAQIIYQANHFAADPTRGQYNEADFRSITNIIKARNK